MGKDLKGKELGEGLCQIKDGRYMARYTDIFGKRKNIVCMKIKLFAIIEMEKLQRKN